MKIKNQKDFFSGLLFIGLGIAFGGGALRYNLGDAGRMGPGYFPLLLGSLMAILGVVIALKALAVKAEGDDRIGRWAWRPLVFVLSSNLVFGVLLGGLPSIKLPPAGLIAAIYGLTIIASLAERRFHTRDVLVLATILAAISYGTFIGPAETADARVAWLYRRLKESFNGFAGKPVFGLRRSPDACQPNVCLYRVLFGHADRRAAGHRPGGDHRDAASRHL